ncbi:UDP-N-acetylmuramate dehydrogenase [Paenibacillus xylanilyticus]|uniref:UDP-N-acetylenolpyruvoylglucosamine reductase n=1 Tax=Paenibacillus xylanilyticus TaxID=248903 RepID=A0A7Y6BZ42_9BACL|nr:UDP-N-acetylmuramate dehydrogenase [Paenibacillus xylanilyticus]NUU76850.1 UDP-N-acetylmuramate dehydrogenase [Paenibacillus xylanilyticus]
MNSYQLLSKSLFDNFHKDRIRYSEPIRNYTYTRLGGEADILMFPETIDEVAMIVKQAAQHDIPLTILGYGSNMIVRDGGIRGITISLQNLNQVSIDGHTMTAQSGAAIIDVSRQALGESLTGLEFACGIPGSVGGALYMNAGAYGGQMSDVVDSAVVVTEVGEIITMQSDELLLGYRKSVFMGKRDIIIEVKFNLQPGDPVQIKEKMDELTYARESKQPLEYASCGSVFKRPEGYFAGKLIQDCGLQGTRIGGAEVSRKHSGFIVNVDNATAQDYIDMIALIQEKVSSQFNVNLETEVVIIGDELNNAKC